MYNIYQYRPIRASPHIPVFRISMHPAKFLLISDLNENYSFEYLNFNSFLNGLLASMIIVFNDQWTIITNMAVITNLENRYSMRFFIIFFKMLMNYLLLNSLISFIIEVFLEYKSRLVEDRLKRERKKNDDLSPREVRSKLSDSDFFMASQRIMSDLDKDSDSNI